MLAMPSNILAEMKRTDVKVQVLDYRWRANDRILDRNDVFLLRYRPSPFKLSVAAQLRDGAIQDFGRVMFFPAHVEVETTPAKIDERTRNVTCTFTAAWLERTWPERRDWSSKDLARCYDMRNIRIESAMRQLGVEIDSPGFASELLVDSLTQIIAVELARHFEQASNSQRVRTCEGKLSSRELGQVYEIIDCAESAAPTAEDLARECGISSAHLRRAFKRTTGMTLHNYVAGVRLDKAQTLLSQTELTLKEIAYRLGFSSPATFSSTFKKATGETPIGYRVRQRA